MKDKPISGFAVLLVMAVPLPASSAEPVPMMLTHRTVSCHGLQNDVAEHDIIVGQVFIAEDGEVINF